MKGKEEPKRKEYQKSKRKVVLSVLALVICVAMLLGTTFAWFTDSVTSGRNKIVAGDLDIEAYHTSGKVKDPQKIDINTQLFTDVTLWEPGAVDYENINIKNVGTVAAKVKLQVLDVAKNTMKEGEYDLTQVIRVAVKDGGFTGTVTRESILSDPTVTFSPFAGFERSFALPAGAGETSEKTYGIALYWEPTDSDNNWNANNGKETSDGLPLWIEFGLNVLATQNTVEADSFDNLYDENATYPILAPVVEDIAIEEIETTGQAVEITNETGTSIIPAAEENVQIVASTKVEEPATEKNNYEMKKDGDLARIIETTASTADSVTYDISYIYTEEGNSYNVSEFKGVVTNILTISTGLKNVRITHSHAGESTAMIKTDDPDLGQDGYFYYNDTNGTLKIWSKKYSSFKIQYDTEFAAAVDGQGFMSLKAALAAATNGKVVTLLKDVSEEGLVIDKTIALKGEGKKITANGDAITITANGVFLDKVSAASANGIALVVNKNATGTIVTGGSYQSGTAAVGKQGEGAIRFLGGNGDISVTKASLLGGLHVLNYASGALTVSENTFAVDASLAERTDIVCGLLVYGTGAQTLAASGEGFLNGNTFSASTANYKVLIQDDKWKTCYSDKAVAQTGGACYDTLKAAVDAAEDKATVTLMKDITLTEDLTIDKSVTIEKSTYTITGESYIKAADGCTLKTEGTKIIITSSMPKKGVLIQMDVVKNDSSLTAAFDGALKDGKETYRVLKVNGTKAEVVSMYETRVGESYSPEAGPVQTVAFEDGTSRTKYDGSPLDTYLESTFYSASNMNETAYNAIAATEIYQSAFARNTGNPDSNFTYGFQWLYNGSVNQWKAKYVSRVKVGDRHVYSPDLKDIYSYVGKNSVTMDELMTLFYNSTTVTGKPGPWLRTASGGFPTGETNCAWQVVSKSTMAGLTTYGATWCFNNNPAACPVFTIDLSKLGEDGWTLYEAK